MIKDKKFIITITLMMICLILLPYVKFRCSVNFNNKIRAVVAMETQSNYKLLHCMNLYKSEEAQNRKEMSVFMLKLKSRQTVDNIKFFDVLANNNNFKEFVKVSEHNKNQIDELVNNFKNINTLDFKEDDLNLVLFKSNNTIEEYYNNINEVSFLTYILNRDIIKQYRDDNIICSIN